MSSPSSHAASKQNRGPRRLQRAFSLVEIMIVIVIIGLLASLVTVNVRSNIIRAKQAAARHEIRQMKDTIDHFYGVYGRYPTNEEGLGILTRPTDKLPERLLDAQGVMKDPWGNPYQYNCPGAANAYDVICFGADGKEGGTGVDADINSNNLKE